MQGRPERIRSTMFPDDNMEVPSTQMMRNQQTNLQRLSQPAQILKATVSGLATYQVHTIVDYKIISLIPYFKRDLLK